jgi:hypothetical protein
VTKSKTKTKTKNIHTGNPGIEIGYNFPHLYSGGSCDV